jgi:hypothetical protein
MDQLEEHTAIGSDNGNQDLVIRSIGLASAHGSQQVDVSAVNRDVRRFLVPGLPPINEDAVCSDIHQAELTRHSIKKSLRQAECRPAHPDAQEGSRSQSHPNATPCDYKGTTKRVESGAMARARCSIPTPLNVFLILERLYHAL